MSGNESHAAATRHVGAAAAAVVALAVFLPCFGHLAEVWASDPASDYALHVAWAGELARGDRLETPHFLFHWLVASLHRLAPFVSLQTAGFLVVPVAANVALVLLVFGVVTRALGTGREWRAVALGVVLTVLLCLLGPVNLLTWRSPYLGYLVPSIFHNPTYTVMQPLALLLFVILVQPLKDGRDAALRRTAALAVATILCALAKPNFVLALVPVVALAAAVDATRGERRAALVEAIGLVLPGAGVLAWQFLLAYSSGSTSHLVLAPLAVMGHFTKSAVPKLVLSILFPLGLILLYRREALADRGIRIAWGAFAFGAGATYLLAEEGPRFSHGNFVWSGHICAFILLVASAGFLLRRKDARAALLGAPGLVEWRWLAAAGLLALHAVAGLHGYAHVLSAGSFQEVVWGS